MAAKGRWEAIWDAVTGRLKPDPDAIGSEDRTEPGWRIAWVFGSHDAIYCGMTFGRRKDAELAVRAMYSLDDWDCWDAREARAIVRRITVEKIHQTILEAMAW